MSVVIAEHDVTVHLGDVRDVLREMPAGSVQCVVTSPPYLGLRDYGTEPVDWPAVSFTPVVGLPEITIPAMRCSLGLEPDPWSFVGHLVLVFREARRVLAADGVLWLNLGDSYANPSPGGAQGVTGRRASRTFTATGSGGCTALPAKNLMGIPWRVAFALQADGWILRSEVIWAKRNFMPEAVTDRPTKAHEAVFLLSKEPRYWYDADAIREDSDPAQEAHNERYAKVYEVHTDRAADTGQPGNVNNVGIHSRPGKPGRNARSVWSISSQPFPGAHFATMPPELARRCILAGCPEDGTVLDPFTGSGTTAMVARQLGKRFVGIELNPDDIPIIADRIGQTPLNFSEAVS